MLRWPVLLLLTSSFVQAALALSPLPPPQDKRWVPPPNFPPVVIAQPQMGVQAIRVSRVNIKTEVFAGQARSHLEIRLYNPNGRVLEGELQFPLLDGQTVTGFALDINGHLREASAVPKARGQEIFEDIRRQRVDPGLLETTANNQYKLRVYPIPALGERRVRITVTETLPTVDKGRAGLLRLPLSFASDIEHLSVHIEAIGQSKEQVQTLNVPSGALITQDWHGTHVKLDKQHWRSNTGSSAVQWLQLTVAQNDKTQTLVGEVAGTHYFAAQLPVKDELEKRPSPKHIALVWDASASSRQQVRIWPVLDAYVRNLNGNAKLSLIVMRDIPEAIKTFTVGRDGIGDLATVLKNEAFDGASNFDVLPIPTDADAVVMVTDGLMTAGKRSIGYTHSAPVFVLNGSASADLPRLRRLAERTGGALVDTTQTDLQNAIKPMLWQGWSVQALRSLSAKDLVAKRLTIEDGRLAIAGVLEDSSAQIDVYLKHNSGRRKTLRVQVQREDREDRWPAQQWAAWRSFELAENPQANKVVLERIAAMHGIVGPNSSLIVLETAQDYARYEIPAPPELAQDVQRLAHLRQSARTQTKQTVIEQVVAQFKERQTWWNTKFELPNPKPAEPPVATTSNPATPSIAALGRNTTEAPVPPARPVAPAPMPPPPPMVSMHAAAAAPPPPAPAPMPAPAPAVVAPRISAPTPAPAAVAPRPTSSSQIASAPPPANVREASAPEMSIRLQASAADAPYLKRLDAAKPEQMYALYLDERTQNSNSSGFYLDVADLFFKRAKALLATNNTQSEQLQALGLRILSNLAEMNLESRGLLRIYAYRLTQAGRHDLAIPVFERIKDLAPNEPQSWRDLGMAYAQVGQTQAAVDTLYEVVTGRWHVRFASVNLIALTELNAIAANASAKGFITPDLSRFDTRLIQNLPLDLRIVMSWDTDDTDIDMFITNPIGERFCCGRSSAIGDRLSQDVTGGYGPEEYSIKEAVAGHYVVEALFYGHNQQVLTTGTVVMVRLTTDFGKTTQQDQWLTLTLKNSRETARVGQIEVKPNMKIGQ